MTRSESDGTSNVPPMVEDVQGSAIPDERTKHEGQSLQSSVFSRPTKNRRVESGDNDFQCLAATSEVCHISLTMSQQLRNHRTCEVMLLRFSKQNPWARVYSNLFL